jgi:hypothetical protein
MHDTELFRHLHALLASSLRLWDTQCIHIEDLDREAVELGCTDGRRVMVTLMPAALRDIARWSVKSSDGTSRLCSSVLGVPGAVAELFGIAQQRRMPLRLGVMGAPA